MNALSKIEAATDTTLWTDDPRVPVLAKAFRDLLTISRTLRENGCDKLSADPIYFVGTMERRGDWFGAVEHGPRQIRCNGNSALQAIMDSLREIRSDWITEQGGRWNPDYELLEELERDAVSVTDALEDQLFKLMEAESVDG